MDLRQLQQFIAVAEDLHFTRAARRLNLVQSALSASIQSLEAELGAQLFQRTTRGVRITAEGEALLEKARLVLTSAREAREAVMATQRLERGRLTLGIVQSLVAFLDLPELLQTFHDRHPKVEVRLRHAERSYLVDQVSDGRIDLAIVPAVQIPEGLGVDIIIDEPLVLACRADNPLAERTSVASEDLAREVFVEFQPGWGTRSIVDRYFAETGFGRRILFEVSTLDNQFALVARGMGVALAPCQLARKMAPNLALVPLTGEPARLRMLAVYLSGADGAPQLTVARAFKAVLGAGRGLA